MRPVAIIVAGGAGQRLGAGVPKQFIPLGGKPMLVHSALAFSRAMPNIHLVIALPEEYLEMGEKLLADAGIDCVCVAGGNERFHSVKNALSAINADASSFVAVHDAARPFISEALIQKCFAEAAADGSAVPLAPLKDSLRREENGQWIVADRNRYRAVQTPQVFPFGQLKQAYEQPYQASFTDDASVYESAGFALHFIEGEEANFKVTTAWDLELAQYLAEKETLKGK